MQKELRNISKLKMEAKQIAGILVLYKCALKNSDTLLSLNASCKANNYTLHIAVYDNSPNAQSVVEFSNLLLTEYVHNAKNPGVSAGYNHFSAILPSHLFLLLLDQDTLFPENFMEEVLLFDSTTFALAAPILKQKDQIISPHQIKLGYSFSKETYAFGKQSLNNKSILNSGILVSQHAYRKAGGYAEDVPLYFSDQVFIQRLKNSGLSSFFLLHATCQHAMASNSMDVLESFKNRYNLFLTGAKQARKYFPLHTAIGLNIVVFLRALKLSITQRNLYFITQWLKL